jgi:hypothetical protein
MQDLILISCYSGLQSPINWLEGSDIVVVDPPRKGLDLSVLEALRLAAFRGLGQKKAPSSKVTDK